MQCINCGAEIDNRSKFCPLCGTKQLKWESLVSEEETSVSEAPAEETEAQASEDITRIKKVLEDFYAGEGEETVEEAAPVAEKKSSALQDLSRDAEAEAAAKRNEEQRRQEREKMADVNDKLASLLSNKKDGE